MGRPMSSTTGPTGSDSPLTWDSTIGAKPTAPPTIVEARDAIHRSIRLIAAPDGETEGVVEFRALGVRSGKWKNTISGYYDYSHLDKAAHDLAVLDHMRRPKGIYMTINPVNPALLARACNRLVERPKATTSDADIVRRRWLPFDIDPKRPSGISATDAEVDLAVSLAGDIEDILRSMGWSYPLYASSGNGQYMLYRVDLPNDAASLALVNRIYAAVNHRLGGIDPSRPYAEIDTTVGNAARILRVGGTINRKGDETPDRPWRVCEYYDPDPDYPIDVNTR